jgi:hypothetical protein
MREKMQYEKAPTEISQNRAIFMLQAKQKFAKVIKD